MAFHHREEKWGILDLSSLLHQMYVDLKDVPLERFDPQWHLRWYGHQPLKSKQSV